MLIPHKHLINPIKNKQTIDEVLHELKEAHKFIVEQCSNNIPEISVHNMMWGIEMKRNIIPLNDAPGIIGKAEERFSEILNILATVERLIDSLEWFKEENRFKSFEVEICNPSTSSALGDNDLILVDRQSNRRVLCEVCDIVSTTTDSNDKEAKELISLGFVKDELLSDEDSRFIATSPEFAGFIGRSTRRWKQKHYGYEPPIVCQNKTILLEVKPNSPTAP